MVAAPRMILASAGLDQFGNLGSRDFTGRQLVLGIDFVPGFMQERTAGESGNDLSLGFSEAILRLFYIR